MLTARPAPPSSPEGRPPSFRRFVLRVAWFVARALVVVLVAALVAGLSAWRTIDREFETSDVVVPSIVGLTLAEATERLSAVGLEIQVEGRQPHESIPPGGVFSQDPAGGGRTRRGRHVQVMVSRGVDEIVVPDLKGQTTRGATMALESARLALGPVTRVHSRAQPAQHVLGQDPPAGSAARHGDPVSLLVSMGPRSRAFVMPDLTGQPLRRVEGTLGLIGMRISNVRREAVPGVAADAVVSQFPPAGSRVGPDASVTLVVGAGAPDDQEPPDGGDDRPRRRWGRRGD